MYSALATQWPNPRVVSNTLFAQDDSLPNEAGLSGYVYAFGQFISHDIQETLSGDSEFIGFQIPRNDPQFDPFEFPLTRSLFDPETGRGRSNPRQQINFTTAYIDASPVYGNFEELSSILRGGPAFPGAKLRTSNDINGDGETLLPRDAFGPVTPRDFVAGDARVNDNVVLSSIHTVFLREHNRLVDELIVEHPDWTVDQLYQRARKIVGAELQAVTFNEFLPALLGDAAPALRGEYDPTINSSVLNEFATVFLRIGHSMLTPDFKRIENDGTVRESIPLDEAFFNPGFLDTAAEMELLLKGLSKETQEEVDIHLVDEMRLAALGAIDLQRARDHGLTDYNSMREAYGLERVESFSEITSDEALQAELQETYGNVDMIEPFAGALAEDHMPGANVGPLTVAVYSDQFVRLRDGDRFWYSNDDEFTAADRLWIENTKLGDIIERNSGLTTLQSNVFLVATGSELDCNGDGVVDAVDLACANAADITTALRLELGLPHGDLNADNQVSFPDFLIVADNFGLETNDYTMGDVDGNGVIGFPDFLALADNFGSTRATVATVPEPTTKSMLFIVLCAGLARRRQI